MADEGIFGDIEQDNNPSWYQSSRTETEDYANGSSRQSPDNPITEPHLMTPNNDPKHSNVETFHGNDLINSSIGLSQKIRKMLNSPKLTVDVISSERVMNSIVVYLIQLKLKGAKDSDAIIVKRRYSEFKSLRDNLVKMYPTIVVPPIPEKHTFLTYLINSIDSSRETNVIELRKRYFKNFLQDVIFDSNTKLRNCPLLHKFLDPNYESCWESAINEPPANLIPSNLLLANPNDTTDQNGLYLLLPSVTGFDLDSTDNLSGLKKLNDDIHKLHADIKLYDLKENNLHEIAENDTVFSDIPIDLINFEINFHRNIKVLHDVQKLNNRSVKNFKTLISTLIELGANLNNFSLQIHDASTHRGKSLSSVIEKFGSAVDSTFLNFEHFLYDEVIPDWDDPVNRFVQYYFSALQLVKFYKYKLIQFKLIYKLKFNKFIKSIGFDLDSTDNLSGLKKLNDDIHKLHADIKLYDLKENNLHEIAENDTVFSDIPIDLINFEINFHRNIKVLHDVQKLNNRSVKNFKTLISTLIELGANLNNFSLQIHDASTHRGKSLSSVIEKFGSAVDSTFLNFEHFLYDEVIPDWDDPVNRFVQYYFSALQLVKFYKYKLIQFKLIYKLKFNKVQEMSAFHDSMNSVKHLKDLDINSPSIKKAIQRIENRQQRVRQLQSKKSWYGLFGGTKSTFTLPEQSLSSHPDRESDERPKSGEDGPSDMKTHYQHKMQHIDKELSKLDQLIDLVNGDMISLTQNLQVNFQEFLDKMERKWLTIMLEFVRAGKQLFEENLNTWSNFKRSVDTSDE
ncbi:Sorting nexin-41 [Candidozyma auris]